jgi:DNA polymerase
MTQPAMDERLRALARACPARLLFPGATQVVPGEGNPAARLVLVGEAPGADEDRLGRPFVGRSGKLLDQMLTEAGLSRDQLWITNTVKCRPVIDEGGRVRNRAPLTSEVKAWLPVLQEELQAIGPVAVVGLGAIAGKALAGPTFAITRERGRWFTERLTGRKALVTWHPAYLLRQTGAIYSERLAEGIADLAAARIALETE